jgi:hypothetical protein
LGVTSTNRIFVPVNPEIGNYEFLHILKTAVPTTDKAVGNVDKDFIEVICDPTIPLKKTVIILAVNPKT